MSNFTHPDRDEIMHESRPLLKPSKRDIVHFHFPGSTRWAACGSKGGTAVQPEAVTCLRCKRTNRFKKATMSEQTHIPTPETLIPNWSDCQAKAERGIKLTPLEVFVINNEPAGFHSEAFRKELREVIVDLERRLTNAVTVSATPSANRTSNYPRRLRS